MRPMIELKAVVLPMLINARMMRMEREKRMAFRGMGVPIVVTWLLSVCGLEKKVVGEADFAEPI